MLPGGHRRPIRRRSPAGCPNGRGRRRSSRSWHARPTPRCRQQAVLLGRAAARRPARRGRVPVPATIGRARSRVLPGAGSQGWRGPARLRRATRAGRRRSPRDAEVRRPPAMPAALCRCLRGGGPEPPFHEALPRRSSPGSPGPWPSRRRRPARRCRRRSPRRARGRRPRSRTPLPAHPSSPASADGQSFRRHAPGRGSGRCRRRWQISR